MDRYRWVKFRSMHASGPGQWRWREYNMDDYGFERTEAGWAKNESLTDDDHLKVIVENLADELNTYSELYRGAEAHFEDPPLEELVKMRLSLAERIEEKMETANRWDIQIIDRKKKE